MNYPASRLKMMALMVVIYMFWYKAYLASAEPPITGSFIEFMR